MKDNTHYQVFEKQPNGHKEIHNFRLKCDAVKKHKELTKAGTVDGDIWDCQNNSLSNLFRF